MATIHVDESARVELATWVEDLQPAIDELAAAFVGEETDLKTVVTLLDRYSARVESYKPSPDLKKQLGKPVDLFKFRSRNMVRVLRKSARRPWPFRASPIYIRRQCDAAASAGRLLADAIRKVSTNV